MKFEPATDGHAALMGAHISGNYKVVKYGRYWFAFVKADYAKSWGMSCFHKPMGGSVEYSTRLDAQRACSKHYTEYKLANPNK